MDANSEKTEQSIPKPGETSQRPINPTSQTANLTYGLDLKQTNTSSNVSLTQFSGLTNLKELTGPEKNYSTINPAAALASMATSTSATESQFFKSKSLVKKPLSSDPVKLISKRRLQDLVTKIDPTERLDPEAEDILLEIADEFIDSVAHASCRLAKHRKSQTLEVKDVQLHLERNWNIRIPGYGADEVRTIRRAVVPASHLNKLAAVSVARSEKSKSNHAVATLYPATTSTLEKPE